MNYISKFECNSTKQSFPYKTHRQGNKTTLQHTCDQQSSTLPAVESL